MAKHKPLKQIQATTIDGGSVSLYYAETPDHCPRCHVRLYPRVVAAALGGLANQQDSQLQVVFQCTDLDCQEAFIATYDYTYETSHTTTHDIYKMAGLAPKNAQPAEFSKSVSDVSPTFVRVYNQAMAAEAGGLDEITGIGLRKSLEFLIKDFAINQRPADAADIQSCTLGQCINNYVDDANVKNCAARATWLGNDETHYIKKWLDKDINDLKTLIKLTVNWIDNVLLTEEYLRTMAT